MVKRVRSPEAVGSGKMLENAGDIPGMRGSKGPSNGAVLVTLNVTL